MSDDAVSDAIDRAAARCGLTTAEEAVLRLACAGRTRVEIATLRGVKRSTVKVQVRNLLGKLGAKSLALAVTDVLRDALRLVFVAGEPTDVRVESKDSRA